jgi:hypothetical protein
MVPFGTPGELLIRGYLSMLAYWGEDDKTKQIIGLDRWVRTGWAQNWLFLQRVREAVTSKEGLSGGLNGNWSDVKLRCLSVFLVTLYVCIVRTLFGPVLGLLPSDEHPIVVYTNTNTNTNTTTTTNNNKILKVWLNLNSGIPASHSRAVLIMVLIGWTPEPSQTLYMMMMTWELPTFKQMLQWLPRYYCLATTVYSPLRVNRI